MTLVAVLVGYPLSFGPACWWMSRLCEERIVGEYNFRRVPTGYWPIGYAAKHGPRSLHAAIAWFATAGLTTEPAVYLFANADQSDGIMLWNGFAQ